MLNFLLMILSSLGMLGVGWFVWKKVQAQDAPSTTDKPSDSQSDDKSDSSTLG